MKKSSKIKTEISRIDDRLKVIIKKDTITFADIKENTYLMHHRKELILALDNIYFIYLN